MRFVTFLHIYLERVSQRYVRHGRRGVGQRLEEIGTEASGRWVFSPFGAFFGRNRLPAGHNFLDEADELLRIDFDEEGSGNDEAGADDCYVGFDDGPDGR